MTEFPYQPVHPMGGTDGEPEPRECPELKKIGGGDEIGYVCKLADKWCHKERGYPCEEYDRIMKEMADEVADEMDEGRWMY